MELAFLVQVLVFLILLVLLIALIAWFIIYIARQLNLINAADENLKEKKCLPMYLDTPPIPLELESPSIASLKNKYDFEAVEKGSFGFEVKSMSIKAPQSHSLPPLSAKASLNTTDSNSKLDDSFKQSNSSLLQQGNKGEPSKSHSG